MNLPVSMTAIAAHIIVSQLGKVPPKVPFYTYAVEPEHVRHFIDNGDGTCVVFLKNGSFQVLSTDQLRELAVEHAKLPLEYQPKGQCKTCGLVDWKPSKEGTK